MYQSTPSISRYFRIFISSTFRDMQKEREILVKHVFPEIKKIARERFVEISEVDLRWGVTPELYSSIYLENDIGNSMNKNGKILCGMTGNE